MKDKIANTVPNSLKQRKSFSCGDKCQSPGQSHVAHFVPGKLAPDALNPLCPRATKARAGPQRSLHFVLKEIADCLERGATLKLSSFGSFVVRKKGQRMGRNPTTGEEGRYRRAASSCSNHPRSLNSGAHRTDMFSKARPMKERTPSHFPPGSLSSLPELAAHCAISLAIAHTLLA
jgi:Bacterial DNA-binding protein